MKKRGARQNRRKRRNPSFMKDMENDAQIVEGRMDETKKKAGRPRKHDRPGRSGSFWLTRETKKRPKKSAARRDRLVISRSGAPRRGAATAGQRGRFFGKMCNKVY